MRVVWYVDQSEIQCGVKPTVERLRTKFLYEHPRPSVIWVDPKGQGPELFDALKDCALPVRMMPLELSGRIES